MTHYKVSVIIPLAWAETISDKLIGQLSLLPNDWEILLCSPKQISRAILNTEHTKYIMAQNGRAYCLNEGAKQAKGEYLWFLHADSLLMEGTVSELTKIVETNSLALYYFNLVFYTNDCHMMKFTAWGVRFRCKFLKTPFGDQGFFMKKSLFEEYGNYSTTASYGEDHLLVRNFRRNKIPIKRIGLKLYTSATKYERDGWLKTTVSHLYLWRKQASSDEKLHRKEPRNENSSGNILQDTRRFAGENSVSIRNRQTTGGNVLSTEYCHNSRDNF